MPKTQKKVFMLMSGGVDSSVAAALLQEQGYEVVGAHLKCWSDSNVRVNPRSVLRKSACPAEQDEEDARRVANKLGIPFHVFDFEKEYREAIVAEMVAGYRNGITPNPDVWCNSRIKFGAFFEKAMSLDADYVASGHYARLHRETQNSKFKTQNQSVKLKSLLSTTYYSLLTARDSAKDQTYFLWQIPKAYLPKILFPIGEYLKSEVRELAKKFNLPTAEKKDSQGLCFVGKVKFTEFLREYLPPSPGPIYDASGAKVGEHEGAQYVTVGQRHGLNIQNGQGPYYVSVKDVAANAVVVAREGESPLCQKETDVSSVNWLIDQPSLPLECEVRIRYRQPFARATLTHADLSQTYADNYPPQSEIGSASIRVIFEQPQRAVTPGQSAVFYKDGVVLGGGIITQKVENRI